MKAFLAGVVGALATVFGSGAGATECRPSGDAPVHINQGVPQVVQSPDCKWEVEVLPEKGADDTALVLLRERSTARKRKLLDLFSDGTVVWSSDSSTVVIEDMRSLHDYGLFVFGVEGKRKPKATAVDALLRKTTRARVVPGTTVDTYAPRFVAWKGDGIVVSAGTTTATAETGPMESQCIAYEVGLNPVTIRKVLTAKELKDQFNARCETSEED